jgi:drug/metabolite transporter (DMT)-like permease
MARGDTRAHAPALGILFMLGSTLFYSLADALSKWLVADYPIVQVAWLRNVFGLVILAVVAFGSGSMAALGTKRMPWHLLRSAISITVTVCMFYALRHIPLAEYVAIIFAVPFFVALLSPWLLDEPVPASAWVAIAIGFAGVLLVARPAPGHFHVAHLVMLAVAILLAVLYLLARTLAPIETPLAMNFHTYPLSVALLALPVADTWVTPTPSAWLLVFLLGACASVALWCVLEAMRHAPPALVAPFDYARLVWITLMGWLVWGEIPDRVTMCGIVLIVASGVYVLRQGRRPKTA